MDPSPRPPRRWLAVLLSLASPGLGHLYAGSLRAALAIGAAWLGAACLLAGAMRLGFAPLVAAAGLYLSCWIVIAGWAARAAAAAGPARRGRLWRALGLLAFFAIAGAAQAGLGGLLKRRVAQGFVIPGASMAPAVEAGDWIVVAPGLPVERGAVVVHEPPPGAPRREALLKRVAGVGGDAVAVENGALVVNGVPAARRPAAPVPVDLRLEEGWHTELAVGFLETSGGHTYGTLCTPERPCGDVAEQQVPPGHLFLLGDYRDHSADSRVYGPVLERNVLGRARYVYFSIGPGGVRWNRLGRKVD